ncbi:hypothetical protein, partial [Mammaliicoccus sciuri]
MYSTAICVPILALCSTSLIFVSKDSFLTDKLVYVIEDLLNLMKRNASIKQRLLVLAEEFEEFKIIKSIPGI